MLNFCLVGVCYRKSSDFSSKYLAQKINEKKDTTFSHSTSSSCMHNIDCYIRLERVGACLIIGPGVEEHVRAPK